MLCLLFAKPNTLPAAPQSSFSLFVLPRAARFRKRRFLKL
jgi:hypothetical protein